MLHSLRSAFVEHNNLQCGYRTPGQILSALSCVLEGHAIIDAKVRGSKSGNICRCGAYPDTVATGQDAASRLTG